MDSDRHSPGFCGVVCSSVPKSLGDPNRSNSDGNGQSPSVLLSARGLCGGAKPGVPGADCSSNVGCAGPGALGGCRVSLWPVVCSLLRGP